MAQISKPPEFSSGARVISAKNLNELRDAIPRLLIGGRGVNITSCGDRYMVSLAEEQGRYPSPFALMEVVWEYGQFLWCYRKMLDGDDQLTAVAKPWHLRWGVNFPEVEGVEYEYPDRADDYRLVNGITQQIYPPYQEGQEILAVRLPSVRIEEGSLQYPEYPAAPLVWLDMNVANRSWGAPIHAHSGIHDGGALQSNLTATTNEDDGDEELPLKWRKSDDEVTNVPHSSKWPDFDL